MRQTLADVCSVPFVARLASFGERAALITPDGVISYAELAARVEDFAARLGTARRLVLVAGANQVEPIVAYLGALAGGHPVVLVPGDSETNLAAVESAYDPDVVVRGSRLSERRAVSAHELHPSLALLLSTSGSTGSPKLVRLSAQNIQANAESISAYLSIRPTDVAATTLPMHYCYGLSVINSHLASGATLLLTSLSVVDACFWDAFRQHGGTTFAGVPYTFDLLDRVGFAAMDLPTLRYITQAGGRLSAEQVRRYADLGERNGFDLFVMYGQTEATARMAYLPPGLARSNPSSIGVPVPGGSFSLAPLPEMPLSRNASPDEGDAGPGAVGELVYSGPNVMLGYAESPADLARGREVTSLHTGDVARRNADGLYEIIGRRNRFAKIFGLRVDLEQVERVFAEAGVTAYCADGDDELIVAVESDQPVTEIEQIAKRQFGLPPRAVRVCFLMEVPRLATGKPDYRSIAVIAADLRKAAAAGRCACTKAGCACTGSASRAADPVASPSARPSMRGLWTVLRGYAASERSITPTYRAGGAAGAGGAVDLRSLYAEVLKRPDATEQDSFVSLDGDSLSYVEMSIRLEEALGHLPPSWHLTPIGELAPSSRRRWRGFRSVETNVLLRALAIVLIVGSHGNLFLVMGGAHLLLGVSGFNFGRFQLTDVPRADRVRRLLGSIARIVVPSVLWIGLASLFMPGYTWQMVTLLNGVLGPSDWAEPQWHYWFIEALVYTLLALTALIAVPLVDRLERRWSFWLPVALAGLGLLTRYEVLTFTDGDLIHRAHMIFWLFAIGWATVKASSVPHRLLVSALVLATVPGFFEDPQREGLVLVGMLLLVWLRQLLVPAYAARAAGVLASASLYIYLCHWQIYPHFEDRLPLVGVALSLAGGVAFWQAATRLPGRLSARWPRLQADAQPR